MLTASMWVLSVKPLLDEGSFLFCRCFSPLNPEPAQSISVRYPQGGRARRDFSRRSKLRRRAKGQNLAAIVASWGLRTAGYFKNESLQAGPVLGKTLWFPTSFYPC